jgi:hypothetical protein
MKITYCFDAKGGFYAKSESSDGVLIEYAYPSSEYAVKAKKMPAHVALLMVGCTADLAYYQTRSWFAAHVARMAAEMTRLGEVAA